MGLLDYIKGKRYGKDANQLERESMEDAFLQEALDGYDTVISNHINSIERLQEQIEQRSKASSKSKRLFYLSVAAGVVLVLAVGSIFIFSPSDKDLIAKNTEEIKEEKKEGVLKVKKEDTKKNIVSDSVVVDNAPKPSEMEEPPKIDIVSNDVAVAEHDMGEEVFSVAEGLMAKKERVKTEQQAKKDVVLKAQVEEKKASSKRLAEVAETGRAISAGYASKSTAPAVADEAVAEEPQKDFEKGEFENYFLRKAKKTGEENEVKVEFIISDSQRPSSVVIKEASSEEAKKEALRIINSSPKWTESAGKKIKMRIKW